jgi:hypothetical protein
MENNLNNRIYSLVNIKNTKNKKKHFKYGWASNPYDVVNYFLDQQKLPKLKRYIKQGTYIVLYHDRDTGEVGYARFGNDPTYIDRKFTMN